MKLISDENIPHIINNYFKTNKVDVVTSKDLGLTSAPDEHYIIQAQKLRRTILTGDLGFTKLTNILDTTKYGLILLRYKGKIPEGLYKVLAIFIVEYRSKSLNGKIIVVDQHKFRVRDIPKDLIL